MSLSMYAASIPTFVHGLKNLSAILDKAEKYAQEKKIDPSVLITARLYPDMFALSRQVQIACDIVKGGVARLAGGEVPSFPDTESTFAELQARIQKTIDFIESKSASQVNGSEERDINLTVGGHVMKFTGQDYLLKFVIPNFYFHISVTYSILRHNGVGVGKMDFLGNIQG
jgi:uncharacterized protein